MPFHPTIDEYIRLNPKFKDEFKIYNTRRFSPLGIVIISGIVEYPNDEIIGLFSLEKSISKRTKRTFIQDYLVWHKIENTFTHYTTVGLKSTLENVEHIYEFWKKYGMQKYYGTTVEKPLNGDHWYDDVNELPLELQQEGKRVLEQNTIA